MKKAIKLVSLLTAAAALICVMPTPAHALTDARYACSLPPVLSASAFSCFSLSHISSPARCSTV